ncbi:beta-galactosidase [Opitutaceae bacterium TAV5]|nr:beta-galactosidase [Opitutaceae bacterium TAV5]
MFPPIVRSSFYLLLAAALIPASVTTAPAATPADDLPFANGFPFHIPPTGTVAGTAPAALAIPARPAGADGRVIVRGDQFLLADTGTPIRFWGVNLCFSGAFPDHATADRIAARLASLGVNIVRFHHIDQRRFPGGLWHRDSPGATNNPREDNIAHRTLDPEALDRLDYLVARLKEHGIYTNLNLKVSRIFSTFDDPAFPAPAPGEILPKKGKGFDQFYTPAIEAQKAYARLLLTRRNAWTGLTWAEDPAVAQVEINNENGILWAWNYNLLDRLPAPYLAELAARWNTWLRARYTDTAALRTAWDPASGAGVSPASDVARASLPVSVASRPTSAAGNANAAAADADLLAGISPALFTAKKARATLAPLPAPDTGDADAAESAGLRLAVNNVPGDATWNVRCSYSLTLPALSSGAPWTVTLRLRANKPEKIRLRLRSPEQNKDIAPPRTLNLATTWKTHTVTFAIPEHAAPLAAQLTLEAGLPGLVLDIASASLRSHTRSGLPRGEGLASDERPVTWIPRRDLSGRTDAVVRDVMHFLRDTEIAYWREMHAFLRDELRVAAPITTTAVGYTTSQIAAETADFIDTHRYWGAPRFPGFNRSKPWTVEQKAMVARPGESAIERMAARRVFGLPFTVTEYNHPPSSDHHAEGFPLLALWGAAQDWNGLFEFAYSHSDAWESDTMTGFFDTAPNPVHTVAALAASDLFRNRRLAPLAPAKSGYVPLDRQLERQNNDTFPRLIEADAVFGGLPPDAWLANRVGLVRRADEQPETLPPPPASQQLAWTATDPATAHVRYTGEGVAGLVGFVSGQTLDLGWLRITPGDTSLGGFSVVMLNSVDGQPLGASGRYLLTTAVRAANRGMGWNADRTGFDKKWGSGPAQAESAPVTLDFASASGVRVYPLNPDGTRRPELPPASTPGRFEATPASKTLWFEITFP